MHVERNFEARSHYHYCSGKEISIRLNVCVCVCVWVCVCVFSLSYPARNPQAPYCNLWPNRLYNILPHYHINGTIFGEKKVTEHKMCVLIFSAIFCLKHFSS